MMSDTGEVVVTMVVCTFFFAWGWFMARGYYRDKFLYAVIKAEEELGRCLKTICYRDKLCVKILEKAGL